MSEKQDNIQDGKTVIMKPIPTLNEGSNEDTVFQPPEQIPSPPDSQTNSSPANHADEKTVIIDKQPASIEPSGNASEVMTEKPRTHATSSYDTTASSFEGGSAYFEAKVGAVVKDRFELITELGEGGMGSVFRARDQRRVEAEDDHPNVAIKLLTQNFASHPRAFVTLQRETKKTQALAHPNIVTVYDFDRDGDVVFMTMEELNGQTLQDLIAEQKGAPMEKELGTSIIRGIASGLIYAHSKGIVHSDLKPGNIFVTSEGHVKILDFGIARVMDESLLQDRFDVGELSALTPRYASIEMLERLPPDPRDDLFALGIIACEILGGQHPYGRRTAVQVKKDSVQPVLPQLGKLQQKVLKSAIAIDVEDRAISCEKWLKSYDFARQGYKKWVAATCIFVIAFVANLYYINEVSEPQIALSELTPEQQQGFSDSMEEAKLALSFGDLNGALFYLDKSYAIHSQNKQISDLIDQIFNAVERSLQQNNLQGEQKQEVLNTLGGYAAFQTENVQERMAELK